MPLPEPIDRLSPRLAGGLLLLTATALLRGPVDTGWRHAGQVSPSIVLLTMVALCCTSAGAALLIHGRSLFEEIPLARRRIAYTGTAASNGDEDTEGTVREVR